MKFSFKIKVIQNILKFNDELKSKYYIFNKTKYLFQFKHNSLITSYTQLHYSFYN